ncbi:hypothetical protein QBC35DRAFT_275212 [Podospora australis]|uniref:Uncharacterized protein n=1 Tax=Podospora australis TaxID=1536484 RepID=A0AAN6WRU6_9PEZI|nr:hypothetical protein QBC35DRAFT_275212 [Podospora australis]
MHILITSPRAEGSGQNYTSIYPLEPLEYDKSPPPETDISTAPSSEDESNRRLKPTDDDLGLHHEPAYCLKDSQPLFPSTIFADHPDAPSSDPSLSQSFSTTYSQEWVNEQSWTSTIDPLLLLHSPLTGLQFNGLRSDTALPLSPNTTVSSRTNSQQPEHRDVQQPEHNSGKPTSVPHRRNPKRAARQNLPCPIPKCRQLCHDRRDIDRHLWKVHELYAAKHNIPTQEETCPECPYKGRKDNVKRHRKKRVEQGRHSIPVDSECHKGSEYLQPFN